MFKRRKDRLGEYPSVDHANNAMRFLMQDPPKVEIALEELHYAIAKAGGRFYDDVKDGYQKLVEQGKVR